MIDDNDIKNAASAPETEDVLGDRPEDGRKNSERGKSERGESGRGEAEHEAEAAQAPKPKRKYGKFMLGFTALSALIVGGASGGGFVHYLLPSQNTAASQTASTDITKLRAQLTALEGKNAKLERQMSSQFKSLSGKIANSPQAAGGDNSAEISELSSRLDELAEDVDAASQTAADAADAAKTAQRAANDAVEEAASNAPVIDENLLARLEKLQQDGSPALDLSDLQARVGKVETSQIPEDAVMLLGENIEDIKSRQDGIEAQVEALNDTVSDIEKAAKSKAASVQSSSMQSSSVQSGPGQSLVPTASPNSGAIFPKAELLDALSRQTQKKPLFKRALSKHIKVKSDSSPEFIIDKIEDSLSRGDSETALGLFDSLPSEIRSAGRSWRQSFN